MKILVRNSDNVVIYAQPDLLLDDTAHGAGWADNNFNTGNANLLDAELPENWTGAVWVYANGAWSIADQAGYDAHMAQVAAEQARQVEIAKAAIREQIRQLEASQLMPRATREFMLLSMELDYTAEQLAANPGYVAVKAFDNHIKSLRGQLA